MKRFEPVRRFWFARGAPPLLLRVLSLAVLVAAAIVCAALGLSSALTLLLVVLTVAAAQAAYVVLRGTRDIRP